MPAWLYSHTWYCLQHTFPKYYLNKPKKIRDFDEFFAYPWGRVSFEMLMSSIKERDEVALTQSTITLQGYVQSLHMVMTKAVPALTELVRQDSPTDAAGDDDGDFAFPPSKNGIKPAHARTLEAADNVSGPNSSTFSCLFFASCNDILCNRITKFMVTYPKN